MRTTLGCMHGFISARAQATPAITNMTEAKHGSTLRCIVPLLLTSSRRTRSRNVNATACPHLPRTDKRPRSSNMTSPVSPPRAFELHRADWSAGIRSLCAGSASGAAHSLCYPGLRAALATLPAPYQSSASVSAAFQVISTPTGRPPIRARLRTLALSRPTADLPRNRPQVSRDHSAWLRH